MCHPLSDDFAKGLTGARGDPHALRMEVPSLDIGSATHSAASYWEVFGRLVRGDVEDRAGGGDFGSIEPETTEFQPTPIILRGWCSALATRRGVHPAILAAGGGVELALGPTPWRCPWQRSHGSRTSTRPSPRPRPE